MTLELSTDQLNSIKRSYLNILGLFITDDKIESRFLRCLLKWGFQLNLNADDLRDAKIDVTSMVTFEGLIPDTESSEVLVNSSKLLPDKLNCSKVIVVPEFTVKPEEITISSPG